MLRSQNFEPNCLIRRSSPEDSNGPPPAEGKAAEVALWTNHRVMEWLRAVDLAEYAPNLRGSGICFICLVLYGVYPNGASLYLL